MSGLTKWVGEIYSGSTTVAKGMWITLRHLFKEPSTVEYPDINVEALLPERYRGILQVDMDICISCRACEVACPIACIKIEDIKGTKTSVMSRTTGKPTPRVRYATLFDIDIAKCMYCGLCVEPCPTGAIRHTRRFEGTVEDVSTLTYSYVREEDLDLAKRQEALAAEAARVKAEAAAKKKAEAEAKAKAAQEAEEASEPKKVDSTKPQTADASPNEEQNDG